MRAVLVLALVSIALATNGCALLLVGGGATGGYYVAKDERPIGQILSDATITASVKTKLVRDEQIAGLDINVDTHEGVVTLNGHVPSAVRAKRAIALARSVKGVANVKSRLVVLPKS